MARLRARDRVLPCVLDRLTDDEPRSKRETRRQRAVSLARYRASFLRDVEWLLNSKAHLPQDGLGEFEEVSRSVLNYGVRDLTGVIRAGVDLPELEAHLRQVLLEFEPRLVSEALVVRVSVAKGSLESHSLVIEIEGELWAEPVHEPLVFAARMDTETGQCMIEERPHG